MAHVFKCNFCARYTEADELACKVGGSGDGKEPVEVMRQCVDKVKAHYGVGHGEKKKRVASAAATGGLSRAALMDFYKNGN